MHVPPGSLSIALVDYRSVVLGPVSEASCRDAIELVSELARTVVLPTPVPPAHDLRIRLYGGFRHRDGQPTPEYGWLLKHVELLDGLDRNVRTRAEIALNVLHLPSDDLVATYRKSDSGDKEKQKMVDTMIAADAVEVAGQDFASITIVSNDDDFVPVLASISRSHSRIQWLRKPRVGLNDAILRRDGVAFLSDPAWK